MRGFNLFVYVGFREPLIRIKLQVPRFVFLNRFSSGPGSELRTKNYELRIDSALYIITFIPVEGKDNFSNQKNHFSHRLINAGCLYRRRKLRTKS
jgi:hypothetical protein